jgi:hypothetical protein
MASEAREQAIGLLQQPRFVRLAAAKLCQLLGQHSLIYGLFILVVSERESAVVTSVFVLASVLPSVVLSLPGGVVADMLPKKLMILVSMSMRLLVVGAFLQYEPGLALVMVFTAASWCAYEFFSPAENAALPAVVRSDQFTSANSLLHAVGLIAQLGGAGLVAPVAVKLLGADGLFSIVFLLFLVSLALYVSLSDLTLVQRRERRDHGGWLRALPVGLRLIQDSPALLRVTTLQVLLDIAMLVVVVAAPSFISSVLRMAPENAVYIFAPGAIGVFVGLVLAPRLVLMAPPRAVVTLGFIFFAVVVLALPFVSQIAAWLDSWTFLPLQLVEDLFGVRRSIATTVLLLPFGGFGITLVRVATRTVIYDEAPPNGLAQVFAAQSVIGSVTALVPTLAAGFLIDLLDVQIVMIFTGLLVALSALWVVVGPPPYLLLRSRRLANGRPGGGSTG